MSIPLSSATKIKGLLVNLFEIFTSLIFSLSSCLRIFIKLLILLGILSLFLILSLSKFIDPLVENNLRVKSKIIQRNFYQR